MARFCSLYSGSGGNSLFISDNNTKLLVDAGLSGKKIIEALSEIGEDPLNISGILISHEHVDHVRGAGVLSRKFGIPIYANRATWSSMERQIGEIDFKNKAYFDTNVEFSIDGIKIRAFDIPHDASEPVGFNFCVENKKITCATDIGHINNKLLSDLEESIFMLVEANHDVEMLKVCRYPWATKKRILGDEGHLSNEVAAEVVVHMVKRGTKKILLGHLSKENNFPELAYETVTNALRENGIEPDIDISLGIALRDKVGHVIEI